MTIKHLKYAVLPLLASLLLQSCINDDMQECPNEYNLRIVFDRNMLYADAFASCVKSVDIQVFDHATGAQVYRHTESGEKLASESYKVTLPVAPGTYDILCWGGLSQGNAFSYAEPGAKALDRQGMKLATTDGQSTARLNELYHGMLTEATFTDNNDIGSFEPQTQTLHLTKNTNRVNVLLVNLDGTAMNPKDFECTITSNNAKMAYDNRLDLDEPDESRVVYKPWSVTPIELETAEDTKSTVTVPGQGAVAEAGLSAEFSLARLTTASDSRLDVVRRTDGRRIISVPLEDNLLLYRGAFHADMTPAEYLDREDDYSITFIIDADHNWDHTAFIYIQRWATLPVQYQEF